MSFANVPSYTTTQLTNTINDVVGKATNGVDCQAQIGFPGTPTEAIDLLDVLCISKRMADASAGGVTYNYTYDANGNMLSGAGRTLTYTAFNKPNTITANGATTTFTYDADYQRVKKSVNVAGAVTNYFTIGDLYEKIVKPTGGTEHRYTIHAAGRVVAQVSKVGTTFTTQYVHTDLLGSIDALTEKNGTSYTVVESKSFSEFGAARLNTWAKGNPPFAETTLGYTGHEMDVESGLIDMNARLYDPVIGRFVTADSVISNVYDPQNLNRYSYVLNNPFGYTDPTGHEYVGTNHGGIAQFDDGAGMPAATYDRNSGAYTFADGSTIGANGTFTPGAAGTGQFASDFTSQWGSGAANCVGLECGTPSLGLPLQSRSQGRMEPVSEYDPYVAAQSWWYDKPRVDKAMDVVAVAAAGFELAAAKVGLASMRTLADAIPELAEGASRSAPLLFNASRQIDAAWGASTYRHGGAMTGIEHIMYRHGPKSGFSDVSRFSEGTRVKDVSSYVDSALRYGDVTKTGSNGYRIDYDVGRTIGTDIGGNAASRVRVHVRDGVIQTAFPY